jgi:peptide/nickel transport system substrate-binding protein
MNVKPGSPFANAKVREAVRWSINQDEIISGLLQGDALKIQTVIPKGFLGYNADTPYKFDPAKAKQLLAEAGFPNGLEFDFTVSTGVCTVPCTDIAAKLQADFAKAGLKANIKAIANPELLKAYRAQDLQMVLVAWGPDFPDPDGNATPFSDFGAKSLAWRNSWNNAAASKLASEAALETDPAERVKLYKQLTELVLKEGPFAILFQPIETIVISSKVGGFVRSPIGTIRFENITKQP